MIECTNLLERRLSNMATVGPLKSIRRYCLWCCVGSSDEVKLCELKKCALWKYRLGKCGKVKLRVIRAKCIDCSGGHDAEVRRCKSTNCQLFMYRLGTNPKLKEREVKQKSLANLIYKRRVTAKAK